MNSSFSIKTRYLLNCDLLNKNLIKNIYKVPCVDKIKISFSTSDIFDKKVYPSKAFLIFYLIFSYLSFIQVNKIKRNLFSEISFLDKNCNFEISIGNKIVIDQFMFNFVSTKNLFLKNQNNLTFINYSSKETKNSLVFFLQKRDLLLKMYNDINFSVHFNLKNPYKNLILKNIFI